MSPAPVKLGPRQRRTLTIIGALLIVAGMVVLVALERLALPIRMMTGLGDVFIGAVLLVMARQSRPD